MSTGKFIRGPQVSTVNTVPVFLGTSGTQVGNASNLSSENGSITPTTAIQTIGTAANPFSNLWLKDCTRPFYEEGTFVLNLSCPINPGSLSIVYAGQTGTFKRLGNVVDVNICLSIMTIVLNTAAGDAFLDGFPFSASERGVLSTDYQLVNTPGGTTNTLVEVQKGTTRGAVTFYQDNTENLSLDVTAISSGDIFKISGSYLIE